MKVKIDCIYSFHGFCNFGAIIEDRETLAFCFTSYSFKKMKYIFSRVPGVSVDPCEVSKRFCFIEMKKV